MSSQYHGVSCLRLLLAIRALPIVPRVILPYRAEPLHYRPEMHRLAACVMYEHLHLLEICITSEVGLYCCRVCKYVEP